MIQCMMNRTAAMRMMNDPFNTIIIELITSYGNTKDMPQPFDPSSLFALFRRLTREKNLKKKCLDQPMFMHQHPRASRDGLLATVVVIPIIITLTSTTATPKAATIADPKDHPLTTEQPEGKLTGPNYRPTTARPDGRTLPPKRIPRDEVDLLTTHSKIRTKWQIPSLALPREDCPTLPVNKQAMALALALLHEVSLEKFPSMMYSIVEATPGRTFSDQNHRNVGYQTDT
mmetsp:Transcript_1365/g.2920  ORF Transcript_1365/g.2920 Transcript_1365/m.2920 type:complete len:230 (-) Transcript_1365:2137-2826(-)